jgi:outer membrane lipopolysaccharide assembly protein LptE/RlpB
LSRQCVFLLVATVVVLGGCGYSTQGNLPPHIKSVAVPMLKNRTLQPGIESAITSAVIRALSTRLRLVPAEQADSILEGEIVGYSAQGIGFDRSANITAYRVQVTVNAEFRDLRNNAVLWREQGLTVTSDFSVQGSVSDTLSREAGASAQAADEIGRKIVNAAVERF